MRNTNRCAKPSTRTQQWKQAIATTVLILACGSYGQAQAASAKTTDSTRYTFDIPSLKVEQALSQLAKQTGHQLLFSYAVVGSHKSTAVSGDHSLTSALQQLLQTTPLTGHLTERGVIVVTDTSARNHMDKGRGNMNITTKKGLLAGLVGVFAATGGVGSAMAQGGEAATGQSAIDEIIVTSQKREQRLIDVPMSVLAVTGDQLEASGVNDLQSLSISVPGMLVAESGFQRRIYIRGVGNTFGSSSLIGIYVDEASASSIPSGQVDLRIHDLQRVEVLKGPQGTLYGEGSVGGTIRYITKDPQLDNLSGSVSLDGSTIEDGDSSQEIKGIINVPLGDDVGLRVVGQYLNYGGWIDQPALGKEDINNYELLNVRAKMLWQASDNLEIKATAIVHRNDGNSQSNGEDESGNYRQTFGDPSTPALEDNYDFFNVLANYDFGNITLTSSTTYLDSEKLLNNYGGQCCAAIGATPSGLLFETQTTSAENFSQELRLSSNESGSWNWTTGFFYKDSKTIPLDIRNALFGAEGGTLGVDLFAFGLFNDEQSQSWALFGEASYAVTEKLEIGAGLRYFEDDRKFRAAMTGPFQENTFDSLTPKVYASYGVSEDLRLYVNIAEGFRSGGFNGSGQPPFDPENVSSYEIGTKFSGVDGRLNAELALFFSDYEDYQIVGVVPALGFNITSNAGSAEIKGVELSFQVLASEGLEVGFNGNYMDTEFTEITSTSSSHAEGDPLDMVPKYGYSLWADYSFNWFDRAPGFVRIDYNRQGEAHFRNRSVGNFYHEVSDELELMNMRLGWENDGWSLEFYALNLLNDRGLVGPGGRLEKAQSRVRPRTFGLNLGFEF